MGPTQGPDDLEKLRSRLDEVTRRKAAAARPQPQSQMGTAFRFSTELVAALVVGGAFGWGIDRLAGTRPVFLIVFFVLGAGAGIRNVIRAAQELNAQMAANAPDAQAKDKPPQDGDE